MPLADLLKHVIAGKDRPSAGQQNLIVDILKKQDFGRPKIKLPSDCIRTDTNWVAYTVLQIDDISSEEQYGIVYDTKTFAAPNSDNFEILICDGAEGLAAFGFRPVLAKIAATFPSIGTLVGPKSGQDSLYSTYPGFRFLGDSGITGVGWVIRDRGIATGGGNIITSSGQSGVPATFELEDVTFSSGFNGWDGTSDLEVVNTFGDTAEAGLHVQFKWDAASGAYISTDVECP